MKKISLLTKEITHTNENKIEPYNNTQNLSHFTPEIKKNINPIILFIAFMIGVNLLIFNQFKKDYIITQNEQFDLLKREIAQLRGNSGANIVLLNKINDLNDNNRNELLKIIEHKFKNRETKIQLEKESLENYRKVAAIDFDKIINDGLPKVLQYNIANFNTYRHHQKIKENRLKDKHEQIKDAFVQAHNMSQPQSLEKFNKLKDKLDIEFYAMRENHSMKRNQFRDQKFIETE